ncbi:MAG: chorismate synthase [Bradymonadia bacterium]
MGNIFGHTFRVTTFGESHGSSLGVIVDGCPPNLPIDLEALQGEIARRRPGQSEIVSSRQERDIAHVQSGIFEGVTTGAPIAIQFFNEDQRSGDYDTVKGLYRPGHADLTYDARFGIRDYRGGGRASARETIARVAAGGIAKQLLMHYFGVTIKAWVCQIGHVVMPEGMADLSQIDQTPVRCPDAQTAGQMVKLIEEIRADGDTIGGIVQTLVLDLPAGWGAPVFDRLEADLAKACLSIPACKGFEVGTGFGGVQMRGSEHNDAIENTSNGLTTKTNRAGGTLGGISTGAPIEFKCAFKPVSTHFKPQKTVSVTGESVTFKNKGRHDPCVVPRAVPIVEAMTALVLADHALRTQTLLKM